MTAWATIDLAVEAMKRGARDFVPKPWDNERLITIVRTQIELASALRRGRKLEAENQLLRGNAPTRVNVAEALTDGRLGCRRGEALGQLRGVVQSHVRPTVSA